MIVPLHFKRFASLLPVALICGPSYARFLYWSRSSQLLDAQNVWQQFTQLSNPAFEWSLTHYPPGLTRQILCDFYAFAIDRVSGIAKHYDLSNNFYQLFLDKDLFYSCADFLNAADTLEDAQEHKANYLLNLINPQPGERILDLGCGWGGMLKRIYEKTGDRENLCGYTLSAEQKRWIDEQYGFKVELKDFITAEYGRESLDKIYSVGAIEHVPKSKLLPLSQTLARALSPTGRIVHHFFCQLSEFPPARLLFAGTEIFPSAELSSLKRHLKAFEQAGLQIVHHSVHDYRPTLVAWFNRLATNQEAAVELVGISTYNLYLCYLAEAWRLFDDRDLLLMRFVLQRRDVAPPNQSAFG
ncbi:class I SAM-dependent methyltransferase [Phormidium tenue FACHB-886]|nr:class I SAM-dependent methyltransferase [Phormidium tenue FACHB-886]